MNWSTTQNFATREQWLNEGVKLLTPLFTEHSYKVPENLRVSCGFPSKSALALKKRRIGECWASLCSADGHFELFISPTLAEPSRALDVLVHEIVHAVVGLEAGHKAPFKACATAVGLTGQMTATVAGPELLKRLHALSDKLGAYPHAELAGMTNGQKKQGTRMIKVVCPNCGYTVRTTAKWLEVGLPACPCGEEMGVEQ